MWQMLQTCEADVQLARLLNQEDKARHAQELQDLQLATGMHNGPDTLHQPVRCEVPGLPDFATCRVTMQVAARVQRNTAGLAAQLTVQSGMPSPQLELSSFHDWAPVMP